MWAILAIILANIGVKRLQACVYTRVLYVISLKMGSSHLKLASFPKRGPI